MNKKFHFDYDINQYSPVQEDFSRKVNYDEDGNEFITYVLINYPKIQRELGSVNDWKLESLLKAGIDPNFPIHTGYNTRLDGIESLNEFASIADSIISEENKPNE